jgi:hypothetical protein
MLIELLWRLNIRNVDRRRSQRLDRVRGDQLGLLDAACLRNLLWSWGWKILRRRRQSSGLFCLTLRIRAERIDFFGLLLRAHLGRHEGISRWKLKGGCCGVLEWRYSLLIFGRNCFLKVRIEGFFFLDLLLRRLLTRRFEDLFIFNWQLQWLRASWIWRIAPWKGWRGLGFRH